MNALAIPDNLTRSLSTFRKQLEHVDSAQRALEIEVGVSSLEAVMRKAGFGEIEAIRPVRETFLDSRWILGKLLKKIPRAKPPGKKRTNGNGLEDKSERLTYLPSGLNKQAAMEAQRVATLPEKEKALVYSKAKRDEILPTISMMLDAARPWWAQSVRKDRHKAIRKNAKQVEDVLGPFPLIYADPPWKWGHFGEQDHENEKGKGRTPDQHYETMTYFELETLKIQGKPVAEIATDDAAMFMWCTSSNMPLALDLMKKWGFEFKTSAGWLKLTKDGKRPAVGMGLVFRNCHELLLYGTRGKMPGPQFQPQSMFMYPRLRHSEKPPEIRKAIEKMYPDFNAKTRLEMFARGEPVKGWTPWGLES